ncbi:MAG: pyridoxal-dependent decarboxylase [Planctomycetota bacterium]|nr:pyridoxal-dependent decarboxylase [Planctomycetota bacterium]
MHPTSADRLALDRAAAHRAVDWAFDYLARTQAAAPGAPTPPVRARTQPGELFNALPAAAPEAPEPWDAAFDDLDRLILPGITHWQHPMFFAYFPANVTGPSIVGEILSAGLGVQGMLWQTSPACTELETRVLDWLGTLLDLPAPFLSPSRTGGGVIQGTASEATLVALLAARARARARGIADSAMTLYTSTQAHSSVVKAAMIAGLASSPDDRARLRLIETDAQFRMDPAALDSALARDLAQGLAPISLTATVGTTGTTAIDPIPELARIARAHAPELWIHVDAAHAGVAAICPEFRPWLAGLEHADSLCVNPHKWLLTNFDCDCFWTRDRASLLAALSVTPEYLRNAASDAGAVIDYRDWQIPLGRRFRALKLWLVLRTFGARALRDYIREHVRLAEVFESLVASDDRFEIVTPRTMNLVCFRLRGDDAKSKALMDRLNDAGEMFLTHTVLPGPDRTPILTLRLAIGAVGVTEGHVRRAWDLIRAAV